jgi:hypothetical protein
MTPIDLYKKYFPQARPSLFQIEYIETNVVDLKTWNEALTYWAANDYRAQSVFKMVEYYKDVLNPTRGRFEPGRNDEPDEHYNCGKCFDTGHYLYWPDDTKPMESVKKTCECVTEAKAA